MVRVHPIFQVFEIRGEHEDLVQRLCDLLIENTAASVEQNHPVLSVDNGLDAGDDAVDADAFHAAVAVIVSRSVVDRPFVKA